MLHATSPALLESVKLTQINAWLEEKFQQGGNYSGPIPIAAAG
jgi:hypothetical protein